MNRSTGPVTYPIMELFKRLRESGVTITAAINQELRECYGDTISAADLDAVIQQHTSRPALAPMPGLALVSSK